MRQLDVLDFIILAFATYRCAQLFAFDKGPGDVFARLRTWSIGNVRELLQCPYCLGVWFAAFFVLALLTGNFILYCALVILAVAGAQAFLQEWKEQ